MLSGSWFSSVCQSSGRCAIWVAVVLGFVVPPSQVVDIAAAASLSSMVRVKCSRVAAVTAWPMRASKRVRDSVESAAPEKSGCVSVAAQTCSSLSLISRAGCIGRRIFASERAARQQTQLPLVAADSSDMP